ncbi:MAG: coaE [Firmicutes bacterium]|nr:coaE [Bacillota bacterium]
MVVVGLTGGIACGKSTVSNIMENFGAVIIDADKLARQVVEPGQPAWRLIVEWLGQGFLADNQELDRKKLGELVFSDDVARLRLEEITHPCIKAVIFNSLAIAGDNGYKVAVLDVPLLFETGWNKHTDINWLVWVDRKTQLERLIKRDNLTISQAESRIAAQMSLEQKLRLADIVIDNSKSVEDTWRQVNEAWHQLIFVAQNNV